MPRIDYPASRTTDHVDTYHGETVPDPYRWLEEMQSPEVLGWAEAQTAITESILRDDPRWIHLRQRLNTLAKFNKVTPPIMAAGKLFFFENDGTTSQPKIVMLDESTGEARIVLDVNTLSTDGTVAVPIFKPSPDGALMAYAIADGGSDWNVVRVLNVATGENLPDVLERTRYTPISWLEDGSAFYYARYPEKSGSDMQFSQVWLHRIGTPQSDDTLIFETPDRPELNHVPLLTDDRKYIVLNTWKDLNGSRIWVLPLDRPGEVVKLIDDDSQASAFSGNIGTRFYIVTQHGAPRGRVVYIDLDAPGEMHEVIPEGDGVVSGYFGGAALCNGHLVVLSLKDVTSRIDYYTLDGQHARSVDLPTLGTIGMHSFGEADRADFYIRFESFAYPPTVFRIGVPDGGVSPFRPPKLDFDPSSILVDQVFYPSKDGTNIPMFIVHRADVPLDGRAPVYMTAYGGFAVPVMPSFGVQGAPWMAWLELGGVVAVPNLRGGGEYGEEWHRAGMLAKKQVVFDDLHAAAEWLEANGVTHRSRLGIQGGSNGGLLTSAAITQRPDLYGAAVVAVPLTDMLRYQYFTIGRLWIGEYGSSEDPEQYAWLKAYSPLHNIKPGVHYPPTLITTGSHDDRVVPAHAYKFAAAMQAAQGSDAPILLHVETRVGHGIGKPLAFILDSVADQFTFFARQFGVEF
ncbi:MAG: S9 family peptidase [Anaerolineae bacterium]|nr:S9 family peptidase [Anaerolineae bacterium]